MLLLRLREDLTKIFRKFKLPKNENKQNSTEILNFRKKGRMAEWELSKENIQPLRQGRRAAAMLEVTDTKRISEQKR